MRKKKLTIITRCGECTALYQKDGDYYPLGTYLDENRKEAYRYDHCSHARPGVRGPYHTEDLAHPVPTPWFVYLYGAQS